ncbi:MAG TPA: DUF1800 domain-containing protein [Gemmatimonadaceae bacterium]|jgi:uncharacterized protein (DUF1800 family)
MRKSPLFIAGFAAFTAVQLPQLGSPPTTKSSSPISSELLPDEQVQQVLNRLTFGARPGDAEKVRAMGVDKWIDMQLHPERINDQATDALLTRYPIYAMAPADIIHDYNVVQQLQRQAKKQISDSTETKAQARREALREDPQVAALAKKTQQFVGQIQSAQLARAVTTDRQLDEVMVDFWENHFSVFAGKGQTRLFLAQYDRDVIRPNALGKFRDLLGAVAHSPAMLFYLDNFQSVADSAHPTLAQANNRRPNALRPRFGGGIGARRPGLMPIGGLTPAQERRIDNATPEQREKITQAIQARAKRGVNENYARELMELHTLGVDGGYTQKDVQEVARALTGWGFNRQNGQFVFNANTHDAGEKLILGQTFSAGHGEDEGERVLDLVARAPSTAKFITTKLARHFVSDDPPPALVDRCSSTFSKTDGDIRETMKCIITSPEFFSRAAYRSKVKTPFEVVASALRAVNAQPDTTPRSAQIVARLGQPIFGRQTPDGWPDKGDAWMNTGAILNRINFGLSIAGGQVPGAKLANLPNFEALRAQSRALQVDSVVKSMLGGQVSQVTRDVLMSGNNPMLAKTGTVAADMTSDDSTSMMATPQGRKAGGGAKGVGGLGLGKGQLPPAPTRPINLQGLPQVVGLALGAPEFQRR